MKANQKLRAKAAAPVPSVEAVREAILFIVACEKCVLQFGPWGFQSVRICDAHLPAFQAAQAPAQVPR